MAFALAIGDVYEWRINGTTFEADQDVENRFMLTLNTLDAPVYNSQDLLQLLTNMIWRDAVCPNLNIDYSVVSTEFLKISGATATAPTPTNAHPYVIDYSLQDIYVPGTLITGGVATAALPTFAAVSMRKVCTRVDQTFRGGARFGPINEVDTTGDGNRLTSTALTAWNTATSLLGSGVTVAAAGPLGAIGISWVVFAGRIMAYDTPPGIVLDYTSGIAGRVIHAYLGSQVSRKVPVSGT